MFKFSLVTGAITLATYATISGPEASHRLGQVFWSAISIASLPR